MSGYARAALTRHTRADVCSCLTPKCTLKIMALYVRSPPFVITNHQPAADDETGHAEGDDGGLILSTCHPIKNPKCVQEEWNVNQIQGRGYTNIDPLGGCPTYCPTTSVYAGWDCLELGGPLSEIPLPLGQQTDPSSASHSKYWSAAGAWVPLLGRDLVSCLGSLFVDHLDMWGMSLYIRKSLSALGAYFFAITFIKRSPYMDCLRTLQCKSGLC